MSAPAQVHLFNVEMACGGCSGAVTRVLNKLEGRNARLGSWEVMLSQ